MARTGAILAGARAPRIQGPGGARPTASPQAVTGPNFGQISPLAADLANEGGYARAYGNFLQRPTQDFTQGAFGPFSPILPVPVNQPPQGAERPEPRRWQYPVGWNLPTGEPGSEGIKMCSFGTLRTLADIYSVARACIELRKNEIRGLEWDIIPTPEASKAYQGSPSQMADFGKRRAQAMKFFRHPDPDYFSWTSWIDALLEEVFVFDSLSLFLRPKWGKGMKKGLLGSDLDSLELLNGATIRPLLDMEGATPRPPAPAYQQYLYGVPRSDLMTMISQRDIDDGGLKGSELAQFRGDQLLYLPMVPRTWTPYGFPPIERALIPIQSGLQKQSYQLDYFREGTVPSVFISPGDANMTPNQIRELQDALNAIAGDPAWKHKIIVLPPGSHIDPMHTTQIADQFDEVVMNQVCMAFDVMPMELGISPKVSTTMSPGASNQMAKMSQTSQQRTATRPLLNFLCDIFEGILHRVCGQDDMMFTFEGLQEEEDQETMTTMLVQQVTNGFRSVDEAREELNLQPWGLPETGEPVMLTPTGPVPFGAASQAASAQAQASVAGSNAATQAFQNGTATPPGVPGGGPQAQGKPGTPEEGTPAEAQQQGKPAEPGKPAAAGKPASGKPAAASTPNKGDVGGQDGQTPGHEAAEAGVEGTSSAKPGGGSPSGNATGGSSKPPPPAGGKNKAAVAELQALARHLKKGRHITTWEPAHLTGAVLASVAEDLHKGLTPDEAVMTALLTLPADDFKAADADPKVPAGLSGWSSSDRLEKKFNPFEARGGHGEWVSGDELWHSDEGKAAGVTDDEVAAAKSSFYRPGAYERTNHFLRGESKDQFGRPVKKLSATQADNVSKFVSLVNRAPKLTQPAELYRGVGDGMDERSAPIFGAIGSKIGKSFTDQGISSASASEDVGKSYGSTIMHVHAPAGVKVLKAEPEFYSSKKSYNYHQEYSFPPGTKYTVTGDEIQPYGNGYERRVVNVKVSQ
jgi:hypothetical protein